LIFEYDTYFSGKNKLIITTVDDLKIFEQEINPFAERAVVFKGVQNSLEKCKSYAQASFVKNLIVTPPRLPVSFEVAAYRFRNLPLTADFNQIQDYVSQVLESGKDFEEELVSVPQEMIKTPSGDYHIPEGILIKIFLKNESSKLIYYSILHVSPDNEISAIFPNEDLPSPSEYRVGGNKTEETGLLLVAPPQGLDVYKLFFSTREMNLLNTVTTRGVANNSAPENSVEAFLQDSYKTETLTRSAVRVGQQGGDLLNVQNLIINIVPAGQFINVK
jgi:hypothetical protein